MSWPVVELGSVVSFIGGSQPPKSTFKYELEDGYVRLLQIRDYKSDDNLTYIPENSTKKFCSKDDVMIGRYGPPVFQILRGLEGAYNVALMKAQPSEKVDRDYLFYFLKQEKLFRLIDGLSQRTAGQSGVDMDALKAYPMLLPPLEEQKRIAAILAKADSVRRKRQQAIDLADDFLRSVFLDMFGDPVTNPKGWKQGSFSDISVINPKAEKYDDELPVSFVPMPSVSEDSHVLDSSDIRVYSDVKKGFTAFKEGDVLFAKITPCMENGKAAIATGLKNGIGFGSTEFHVFRPDNNNYAPFIYSLIHLPLFRKVAASNFSGAVGHKRVPKDFLSDFKLILPPIELVIKFKNVFEAVNESKTKFSANTTGSNELFHSLSQKAFAGEL
ncbi:restriction endonuclease subunit S [Pseudoalteromonas sp. SCSIO 43095]|uniref:restriction endonuclease subunit S n=1 Tax=Pseudoalteromonas sp. SCSIO 43095 TaxID=2894202 RepID=UPI00202B1603|nr:restriction endonuclease subunit S [Pseudoalteromonas sp. SCSIO 43095]URQ97660.1 restriction endonuclease subunit S [Pseudoalteromonas sp. SCSIO 43095]